jgi:hypothetical protein
MARLQLADGCRVQVCGQCCDELSAAGKTDEQIAAHPQATSGMDRYVAGGYAGHYCDKHWRNAGYRDDLPNLVGGMTDDEIEAYDYRSEDYADE